jgi:hypothetical protein
MATELASLIVGHTDEWIPIGCPSDRTDPSSLLRNGHVRRQSDEFDGPPTRFSFCPQKATTSGSDLFGKFLHQLPVNELKARDN